MVERAGSSARTGEKTGVSNSLHFSYVDIGRNQRFQLYRVIGGTRQVGLHQRKPRPHSNGASSKQRSELALCWGARPLASAARWMMSGKSLTRAQMEGSGVDPERVRSSSPSLRSLQEHDSRPSAWMGWAWLLLLASSEARSSDSSQKSMSWSRGMTSVSSKLSSWSAKSGTCLSSSTGSFLQARDEASTVKAWLAWRWRGDIKRYRKGRSLLDRALLQIEERRLLLLMLKRKK